jgi:hypothetical protein
MMMQFVIAACLSAVLSIKRVFRAVKHFSEFRWLPQFGRQQSSPAAANYDNASIVGKAGGYCALDKDIESRSIDVFLIAGQSNAEGHGETVGPNVPEGKAYQYFNERLTVGNDPIGTANVGSAWPAFMHTYVVKTARSVAVVPTAVGGTTQCSKMTTSLGSWDEGGELWERSVAQLQQAIGALQKCGMSAIFRGVLWCQGESDAWGIRDGQETIAEYESALTLMISRYRALSFTGVKMPFYIFQTGAIASGLDFFAPIREAQERIAASGALSPIVFSGAKEFPKLGLMRTGEHALHYTQEGLNIMGTKGAEAVVAAQEANSAERISSVER